MIINYLPFLQTEKLISERIWGENVYKQIVLFAFSYCSLFFKMSKNMKR